ncbi:MAG: SCO family protein [Rhodoferax sp.]
MSGFKLLDDSSSRAAPDTAAGARAGRGEQLLGLTVHSLPSAERALEQDVRRIRSGRWKMMLVFLVCAAPVLASYITYYWVRPEGRRNFGDLIEPQRPLPALSGVSLSGQQIDLAALKGQWLLISVAGGACDEVCSRHLYLQRQMREGLGKDKDRIDWVWLIADDAQVPATLLPALKEATALRVPAAGLSAWLSPAKGRQLAEHLYVVDPIGNWMLRFPAELDVSSAAKAKRDLERLLRASASWDQPGRVPAH